MDGTCRPIHLQILILEHVGCLVAVKQTISMYAAPWSDLHVHVGSQRKEGHFSIKIQWVYTVQYVQTPAMVQRAQANGVV